MLCKKIYMACTFLGLVCQAYIEERTVHTHSTLERANET